MARVAYFSIFRDRVGEYRWKFVASNGETIAVSSEGYVAKADCEYSIRLVKREAPGAPVV